MRRSPTTPPPPLLLLRTRRRLQRGSRRLLKKPLPWPAEPSCGTTRRRRRKNMPRPVDLPPMPLERTPEGVVLVQRLLPLVLLLLASLRRLCIVILCMNHLLPSSRLSTLPRGRHPSERKRRKRNKRMASQEGTTRFVFYGNYCTTMKPTLQHYNNGSPCWKHPHVVHQKKRKRKDTSPTRPLRFREGRHRLYWYRRVTRRKEAEIRLEERYRVHPTILTITILILTITILRRRSRRLLTPVSPPTRRRNATGKTASTSPPP